MMNGNFRILLMEVYCSTICFAIFSWGDSLKFRPFIWYLLPIEVIEMAIDIDSPWMEKSWQMGDPPAIQV